MVAPTTSGVNPPEEFPMLSSNANNSGGTLNLNPVFFSSLLKPKAVQVNVPEVPTKPVTMLHGEPNVT